MNWDLGLAQEQKNWVKSDDYEKEHYWVLSVFGPQGCSFFQWTDLLCSNMESALWTPRWSFNIVWVILIQPNFIYRNDTIRYLWHLLKWRFCTSWYLLQNEKDSHLSREGHHLSIFFSDICGPKMSLLDLSLLSCATYFRGLYIKEEEIWTTWELNEYNLPTNYTTSNSEKPRQTAHSEGLISCVFQYADWSVTNIQHIGDYFLIFWDTHICHITDPDIVQDHINLCSSHTAAPDTQPDVL